MAAVVTDQLHAASDSGKTHNMFRPLLCRVVLRNNERSGDAPHQLVAQVFTRPCLED